MKVRSILTDQIFEAEWREDHPASSPGQPVLVLEDGQAVDAVWFEILDDEDELIGEC
ncbi:MAG: hypothetical protein WAU81_15990 [Candidatus Aminicenantales bacterium]